MAEGDDYLPIDKVAIYRKDENGKWVLSSGMSTMLTDINGNPINAATEETLSSLNSKFPQPLSFDADGNLEVNVAAGTVSVDSVGIKDSSDTRIDPSTLQKQEDILAQLDITLSALRDALKGALDTDILELLSRLRDDSELYNIRQGDVYYAAIRYSSLQNGDEALLGIDATGLDATKQFIILKSEALMDVEGYVQLFTDSDYSGGSSGSGLNMDVAQNTSKPSDVKLSIPNSVSQYGTPLVQLPLLGGTTSSGFSSQGFGSSIDFGAGLILEAGKKYLIRIYNNSNNTAGQAGIIFKWKEEVRQ